MTKAHCAPQASVRHERASPEQEKRRLVEWLRAELARATGRRYRIDLDALDIESLRELQRLLRDLDYEKQAGPASPVIGMPRSRSDARSRRSVRRLTRSSSARS